MAATIFFLCTLYALAEAQQSSHCGDAAWVDRGDVDLVRFYTCVCAESICTNQWEMRGIVHPRRVGLVNAYIYCNRCRRTCHRVEKEVSNKESRSRRALAAWTRCNAKMTDAWKDLGSPLKYAPWRAFPPELTYTSSLKW